MRLRPRARRSSGDSWRHVFEARAGEFTDVLLRTAEALVVVLDRAGRIVLFNRACEELTGWTEAEVRGRPIFETLIPPEQRDGVRAVFDRLAAGSFPSRYENDWLTSDGGRRWIAWANSVVTDAAGAVDHVIGTGIDITERRRMEDELRASERRHRLLFEEANDAIFIADAATGEILDANLRAQQLVGRGLDALRALRSADLHPPAERGRVTAAFSRHVAAGGQGPIVHEMLRADGSTVPVEIVGSTIEGPGGRRLAVGIVRDLTERLRAEEGRRQMEAQVQHVQKLESLGVLAGGIAHDFNNLMTVILGHAELAADELEPGGPAVDHFKAIEAATRRASELCQQMLAYAGKGHVVVRSVHLGRVVEEMLSMLQVSISRKAELAVSLAADLPPIEADAGQLRQVVMNLVLNASEAIGERSGAISVSTGIVQCDAAYLSEAWLADGPAPGPYVYIEVADTGCGMDREILSRIFDPFFTTKFTGRGLGLAAVLGIVRRHRGAVKVHSEPGRGSTFRVLFPVSEQPAMVEPPAEVSGTASRGTATVLLVDDEEGVRLVGRRMLEKLGYTVLPAADAREAVDLFRRRRPEIAAVLLDLTMPNVDGAETCRELLRLDPAVKVVMSSGYGEREAVQRFQGTGIAGFVEKPYQLETLAAVMRQVLDN